MTRIFLPALLAAATLISFLPVKVSADIYNAGAMGLENAIDQLTKKIERIDFSRSDFEKGQVPSSLVINPMGDVRLTGAKVTSVSGDTVTVEVHKIGFTVHKMADTKVFAFAKGELKWEDIKLGDVVDVVGTLDSLKPAFIHAKVVHDRTSAVDLQAIQIRLQEIRERVKSLIENFNEFLKGTS